MPDVSCTTSRCHADGGPARVTARGVTFAHRRHPAAGKGSVACASCHTHEPGSTTLAAGTASCALCHYAAIAGSADTGCATCHPSPRHVRTTSQGVELPHALLKDAHIPCTRCHFQLVDGPVRTTRTRCLSCHPAGNGQSRVDTTLTGSAAHAAHPTVACTACHEPVAHRVVAMSGSVELDCLTCHAPRHRRPMPSDTGRVQHCPTCHANVHQDQQRMVLGLVPGERPSPSTMFTGGVTCRSCHQAAGRTPRPGAPLIGTPAACTGCHGGAWDGVLARWRRGYARRHDWVATYISAADRALGPDSAPAAARARLREATDLLAFVNRAGPLHNLPLTDRLMRRSLALAGEAYGLASRPVPAAPSLGPEVTSGHCLSCHYGIEEAPLGIDSTGRRSTHADHVFKNGLTCDACHAAGAAPPGFAGKNWMDTTAAPPDRRPPR